MTTDTIDTSALLARYRAVLDRAESLRVEQSKLADEREAIERQLVEFSEAHGVQQFGDDEISVTVAEKLRVKYDPEQWADIVRWDLETGTGAVQRRLTDAKIISLIEDGVPLPAGLSVEGFKKVTYRRK